MKKLVLAAALTALASFVPFQSEAQRKDALYQGFANPPKEARPRVWWHWMNGNITKDGIRKDLEWMDRSGIVGFHNFDAGLDTPQLVEKRLIYMTPEWSDAFSYAIDVADSLGMEMTIASSPGWSVTGGPWVTYEDAMKKLVWRHVEVTGGRTIDMDMPEGFCNSGRFQDFKEKARGVADTYMPADYYKDIAVLAVRLTDGFADMAGAMLGDVRAEASASNGVAVTVEQLADDRISDYVALDGDEHGRAWVQVEFESPMTISSVQMSLARTMGDKNSIEKSLYAGDTEDQLKPVATGLPYQDAFVYTYNFSPASAKIWRLCVSVKDLKAGEKLLVSMFNLSVAPCVADMADKSGYGLYRYMSGYRTPEVEGVKLEDIIDISEYMKDGHLTWDAPAGRWRIYRFGCSLLGKINHPASPEATGLEVDKMNAGAVRRYFDKYLGTYMTASRGRLGEKGVSYLLTDSYEAGSATWTADMESEFLQRKGYALRKWMPALAGMIVEDGSKTERFLFDWRTTLGSLVAENHYDLQNEILSPYGMRRYTESHENFRALQADGMDCKRKADVPMSAFWMFYKDKSGFTPRFEADIRESASVAHIYGQNIAAAESFTTDGPRDGAWVYAPSLLKPSADAAMACGLNRFIIHTSPHQPVDDKVPGVGLGRWGQWFDRHQTWADYAKVWTDYLSRSCYLLQKGRYVADILCYYGEDSNLTAIYLKNYPDIPAGVGFDYASADVLLNMVRVENGKLVTDSGMEYKILRIEGVSDMMSMPVLRRIEEFADAGVIICGRKPARLAGLNADENEFRAIVDRVWNSGRRNVTSGVPTAKVMEDAGLLKDADWGGEKNLRYIHRTTSDGEIYWINNREHKEREVRVKFRDAVGMMPELWRADDAGRDDASYRICADGTEVTLGLRPDDAVFVLFRKPAEWKEMSKKPLPEYLDRLTIDGAWDLEFEPGRGAPQSVKMDRLASLTESEEEGVKYFSGTVTYRNTFKVNRKLMKEIANRKLVIDLGEVYDIAEVKLNGVSLGVLWKAPYTIDVSRYIKKGENTIEIKITNMWHNRLLAEEKGWTSEKVTYVTAKYFDDKEKLTPSGLVGPVKLLERK